MLITIKQETMNNFYDPSMTAPSAIMPTAPGMINPNQVQPSPINPRLFSGMDTINSLNPGSVYNQSQPTMPPNGVQTSITPVLGTENQ